MPASVRHYIKPKEYKELHIGHLDLLRERKNKNVDEITSADSKKQQK